SEVHGTDPRPGGGNERDEPVRFKNAQRFANGQPAHAELFRDSLLADPRAGRKVSVKNPLTQFICDALTCSARFLQKHSFDGHIYSIRTPFDWIHSCHKTAN